VDAGRDLTRAVELEPKSAYNQFMLGFYYYLENDFKKALEPLNRSAELDASNSRTYFYLALTHEGLANASMAIQMYERAMALDRERNTADLDTLVAFARLLFSLGQYEKCLPLVEQARTLDPKSRDAHYERGRLYLQAGDFQRAVQEGERALELQSPGTTDRQIHFLLARAYARFGNEQRADEHLAKFKASAPSLRR
jgi:tetratricopeptide (TPR) repeat protein